MSYVNMNISNIDIRHATLQLRNKTPSYSKYHKKIKIHSKGLPKDFFKNQLTLILPSSVRFRQKLSPTFQLFSQHEKKQDLTFINNQFYGQSPKFKYFKRSKTEDKQQTVIFKKDNMKQDESKHLNLMNVTFANFKQSSQKRGKSKQNIKIVQLAMQKTSKNNKLQLKGHDFFENRLQKMKQGKIVRKNFHLLPALKKINNISSLQHIPADNQ